MKQAQEFARPPRDKGQQQYLAALPAYFFRVLKDFDTYGQDNTDFFFKKGDTLVRSGPHQTKVRLATPTLPTCYSLGGHGLMHEYQREGFVRPLDLPELLAIIPHMTSLIWYAAGQFELRNALCRLEPWRFGENPIKEALLKQYFPPTTL